MSKSNDLLSYGWILTLIAQTPFATHLCAKHCVAIAIAIMSKTADFKCWDVFVSLAGISKTVCELKLLFISSGEKRFC